MTGMATRKNVKNVEISMLVWWSNDAESYCAIR